MKVRRNRTQAIMDVGKMKNPAHLTVSLFLVDANAIWQMVLAV